MEKFANDKAPQAEPTYPNREAVDAIDEYINNNTTTKLESYFEGFEWKSLTDVFSLNSHEDVSERTLGSVHVKEISDGDQRMLLPVIAVEAHYYQEDNFTEIIYAARPEDINNLELGDYFKDGIVSL